jgi:hypothetical protein
MRGQRTTTFFGVPTERVISGVSRNTCDELGAPLLVLVVVVVVVPLPLPSLGVVVLGVLGGGAAPPPQAMTRTGASRLTRHAAPRLRASRP